MAKNVTSSVQGGSKKNNIVKVVIPVVSPKNGAYRFVKKKMTNEEFSKMLQEIK